jgi:hypothetical protein
LHACAQETEGQGPLEASQRLFYNPAFSLEGSSLSEADLAHSRPPPAALARSPAGAVPLLPF